MRIFIALKQSAVLAEKRGLSLQRAHRRRQLSAPLKSLRSVMNSCKVKLINGTSRGVSRLRELTVVVVAAVRGRGRGKGYTTCSLADIMFAMETGTQEALGLYTAIAVITYEMFLCVILLHSDQTYCPLSSSWPTIYGTITYKMAQKSVTENVFIYYSVSLNKLFKLG
jgi:hypothetical protein